MSTPIHKPGDLVQLKSGGPVMTVHDVSAKGARVQCKWFAGSSLEVGRFKAVMLQAPPPKRTAAKKSE